ncbi:MAG: hypothetical protein VYB89_00305, partial [Pseudomonadota bacterium]|nr:hypothetical protein [Pseudomonadota bacterium]
GPMKSMVRPGSTVNGRVSVKPGARVIDHIPYLPVRRRYWPAASGLCRGDNMCFYHIQLYAT